ncbi:hypothetical protein FRC04_001458 [Tulasnella sp. 424]|nr:hypothetical protein FRC04_001458 [Tulasnella sp. 424]
MDQATPTTSQTQPSEHDLSVLKSAYGRKLHNTDVTYMLPADLAEHGRLDVQHEMLKSAAGLYLAPEAVQKALSPRPDGSTPRVLDIGAGSGSWAVDMAKEFPNAEVVGLDIAPVNPSSQPPPNCRFILGDCNTSLDDASYENAFDVIQARCIVSGVPDYRKFLRHVLKALKPGGVFLVLEGRMGCFDENHQPLGVQDENDPKYSWQHKMVCLALEGMVARNDQILYLDDIPGWLKDMGDAWEDIGDKPIWVPIGPWDKSSPALIFQGEAMRQNCLIFTESVQPLLFSRGHPKELVQTWAKNARKELEELPYKQWAKRASDTARSANPHRNFGRVIMDRSTVTKIQTPSREHDLSALKSVHGRNFHNTDALLLLGYVARHLRSRSSAHTADLAEHGRLNVQYEMLKSAAGGLYLAPEAVQKALSPRPDGPAPKVLDIGTGSGIWAVEMAKEFPHAEVVGLDIAPVNSSSYVVPEASTKR